MNAMSSTTSSPEERRKEEEGLHQLHQNKKRKTKPEKNRRETTHKERRRRRHGKAGPCNQRTAQEEKPTPSSVRRGVVMSCGVGGGARRRSRSEPAGRAKVVTNCGVGGTGRRSGPDRSHTHTPASATPGRDAAQRADTPRRTVRRQSKITAGADIIVRSELLFRILKKVRKKVRAKGGPRTLRVAMRRRGSARAREREPQIV